MTTHAPTLVAVTRLIISERPRDAQRIIDEIPDNELRQFGWLAAANLARCLALVCEYERVDPDIVLMGMGLIAAEADLT